MIDKKPKSVTFKLSLSNNHFRQWDKLRAFGSGEGIVTEVHSHKGNTTFDVKPYKTPKNRLMAFLKFQWLKLCVHYS